GVSLDLLSTTGRDLILAGAILSILINSLLFAGLDRLKPWLQRHERKSAGLAPDVAGRADIASWPALHAHTVLVGFGRIGHLIAASLMENQQSFIVIEDHLEVVKALRADGVPALYGNAAARGVMESANIGAARWLLVAIPDALEAGQIIEQAKKLNPQIDIVARAHSLAELAHLEEHGATHTVMGEREIAEAMANRVVAAK
ncbi:MAG: NAD-binding protein, partial [Noviherbaspirillum sp.]